MLANTFRLCLELIDPSEYVSHLGPEWVLYGVCSGLFSQ